MIHLYELNIILNQFNLVGIIFLMVCLSLRTISKWQISGEASPEEKAPRTLWQRSVDVLLIAEAILALYLWEYTILEAMFTVPIAAIIVFFVCLIRYIYARRKQKRCPEEISQQKLRFYRKCLILFTVLLGVALAVGIGFMILFSMALAHM